MRRLISSFAAMTVLACTSQSPITGPLRTAPPTLLVNATTQVLAAPGSAPVLEVSAVLRNRTTERIGVAVGAQCPLFVRLFADPTGDYQASLDLSMACPADASTLELAPGDTAVLTRDFASEALASYAPGTYGVNVAVTTGNALIGAWAGAVHLPLQATP
ncbi:MAG TPA: hypothetical protein VFD85_09240 [Gemmatimonadales bacterium]|nr:hypothetical protein [Gemmatimonadales bacterium]